MNDFQRNVLILKFNWFLFFEFVFLLLLPFRFLNYFLSHFSEWFFLFGCLFPCTKYFCNPLHYESSWIISCVFFSFILLLIRLKRRLSILYTVEHSTHFKNFRFCCCCCGNNIFLSALLQYFCPLHTVSWVVSI